MVDNRAAGFYGIGGAFNFKSGDISGSAANLQDDKMGQGNEYTSLQKGEEESSDTQNNMSYTDKSAQLRATLSSLAMLNVASVIKDRRRPSLLEERKEKFNEKDFLAKTRKRRERLLLSLSDENSDEEYEIETDF